MNAPQPESMNEDDFSKPWPQYTRLFQESPEIAASKALELFSTDDLRYLPFILSFPWEEDASQLPKELHSSHFPIALLDIVTNRRWYAQLRTQKVAGPQGAEREESWIAVCPCSLLSSTGSDILTLPVVALVTLGPATAQNIPHVEMHQQDHHPG